MNRSIGRLRSDSSVLDVVLKSGSLLSAGWQRRMLEQPLRCWGGLDNTFAKYMFASVHSFWVRRYQHHQHKSTNERVVEGNGQRSDLWGGRIPQSAVTWVKRMRVQHLWRHGCWNVSELHSKTGVRGNGQSFLFGCEHSVHHTPLTSLEN